MQGTEIGFLYIQLSKSGKLSIETLMKQIQTVVSSRK